MKRKLMTLLLMITMVLSMASCGGFIMQEETIEIESIVPTLLEDGQTKIVITYKNNMQEPTVFYLPKGEDGIEGVGIESIENAEAEVEGNTAFEIILTSGETKKIEVPNGVSIVDTTTITKEEDGKHYLVVYFSNGETDEVEIFEGPAGKDGYTSVEIESQEEITDLTDPYFGFMKIVFLFSDSAGERQERKEIYVRPGKEGNGIASITSTFDSEKYYVIITYTHADQDGNWSKKLEFPIPQVNKWYSGEGSPSISIGIIGDFYFDTLNAAFYQKIETEGNGMWVKVTQLDKPDTATPFLITLDLNAEDAILIGGASKYITVEQNSNLAAKNKTLPYPYREGYEFAGWYTTPTPTIVNGMFTDLTIVTNNITLYAKWVELPTA